MSTYYPRYGANSGEGSVTKGSGYKIPRGGISMTDNMKKVDIKIENNELTTSHKKKQYLVGLQQIQ